MAQPTHGMAELVLSTAVATFCICTITLGSGSSFLKLVTAPGTIKGISNTKLGHGMALPASISSRHTFRPHTQERAVVQHTSGRTTNAAAPAVGSAAWIPFWLSVVASAGLALAMKLASSASPQRFESEPCMAMAAVTGYGPYDSSRYQFVLHSDDTDGADEHTGRPIDPDQLHTSMVRVVAETVQKHSGTEDYEVPAEVVDAVREASTELQKGGDYELADLASTMMETVRTEVARLGTSPADWEHVGVDLETMVVGEVMRFTGKESYEPGDVSRETARRIRALLGNVTHLTDVVKEHVLEYTGKDHYEFGDLSQALEQRVKDAVGKAMENGYNVGDVSKAIDGLIKHEIETLTGKPYEFGDLSRALEDRLKGAINNFTGKTDYHFGDLTKEAGHRIGEGIKSFIQKEEYQFGDITRTLMGRLFKKDSE